MCQNYEDDIVIDDILAGIYRYTICVNFVFMLTCSTGLRQKLKEEINPPPFTVSYL